MGIRRRPRLRSSQYSTDTQTGYGAACKKKKEKPPFLAKIDAIVWSVDSVSISPLAPKTEQLRPIPRESWTRGLRNDLYWLQPLAYSPHDDVLTRTTTIPDRTSLTASQGRIWGGYGFNPLKLWICNYTFFDVTSLSLRDYCPNTISKGVPTTRLCELLDWSRGTVVERWSLTGELCLSCSRPAADGWPLMWVNRPL